MIIATFPRGVTAMTVNGLHQWDYGQQLQVSAEGIPALVEVHFACPGMAEAIVRRCSSVSGTATAVIPDVCLEQAVPVTAWVYFVEETSGTTVLELTLPIKARTRPKALPDVPQVVVTEYTELVGVANKAMVEVRGLTAEAKSAKEGASNSSKIASREAASAYTHRQNAETASTSASSSEAEAKAAASSASTAADFATDAAERVRVAITKGLPESCQVLPMTGYYFIDGVIRGEDNSLAFTVSFGLVHWTRGTYARAFSATDSVYYVLNIADDGRISYTMRYPWGDRLSLDDTEEGEALYGFRVIPLFDFNGGSANG